MGKYIDLHSHSTASDGTLSPRELMNLAEEANLSAIALTDHDTVDGIKEFMLEKSSVERVAGIELAAAYKNIELHIVGLFIDYENPMLISQMDYLVSERNDRNKRMIKALNNLGIDITINDLEKNAKGNIITRAHYANVLAEKGYVKHKDEAFKKYISYGKPGYVKRETLTPKSAIDTIRKAGGIPVLAHATLYGFGYLEIHNAVKELKEYGLMGIEAIYSTYTPKQEVEIRKICKSFGLLESGGSDFHGDNKPDIKLGTGRGNLMIPEMFLDEMKKILK